MAFVMEYSTDQNVTLAELSRMLPRCVSYWTIWKWCRVGATSKSGRTVRMKSVQLPNGIGSSIDKYDQFIRDLQE